jgi:hypothetical protein
MVLLPILTFRIACLGLASQAVQLVAAQACLLDPTTVGAQAPQAGASPPRVRQEHPMPKMVRFKMVGEAGIEPTTPGLEGRCSIQLSYSPMLSYCSVERGQSASANRSSADSSVPLASPAVGPQAVM